MPPLQTEPMGNAQCLWDEFDPELYVDQNYRLVRSDDLRVLERVRDYFASVAGRGGGRGIDVGPGANLYPSLAMLPLCDEITLWERGSSNVAWLNREVERYSRSWDQFWDVLASRPPYAQIADPQAALRKKARVANGDLFDLGHRQWDVGGMFFVAESITARRKEFQRAVKRFVRALRPGAPFAAAFMRNSTGYSVGAHRFPAVAISEPDVGQCLAGLGCRLEELCAISPDDSPRNGHAGMILALGRAGGTGR